MITGGWMDDELTEGSGSKKAYFPFLSVFSIFYFFFPSLPLSILFDLG